MYPMRSELQVKQTQAKENKYTSKSNLNYMLSYLLKKRHLKVRKSKGEL